MYRPESLKLNRAKYRWAPFTAPDPDAGVLEEGKKLVEFGDWSKSVPACIKCHGPDVGGVDMNFPALAGQHAGYIETQLNAWKQGTRNNDSNQLMQVVAEHLSTGQIKAVAAYLSSMKPTAD